jgi:hypothetical protein
MNRKLYPSDLTDNEWTVYSQFLHWRDKNIFQKLTTKLNRRLRILLGKKANLSVGIVDLMEAKKLKVGKDTYWLITLDC